MPTSRLSIRYTALLFILVLMVGACNRKTVAATATETPAAVPSQPTPPNTGTRTEPPLPVKMKPEVAEADPELSGRGSAKARQVITQQKSGPTEVFTLRKTPCYGDCPVFRITVLSDGTVFYSGIRNVSLPGEYQASVTTDWVDRLQRKAIAQGIFSWSDTYPEDPDLFIADASNTITTFAWNGREKTITHNYDAPVPLAELEKELIGLIDELKWSARLD